MGFGVDEQFKGKGSEEDQGILLSMIGVGLIWTSSLAVLTRSPPFGPPAEIVGYAGVLRRTHVVHLLLIDGRLHGLPNHHY
jgi:hypothetical protein